jgi:hypothetical protein
VEGNKDKGKRKEKGNEMKMKYKYRNQSLTAKHTKHVIHALPPRTLTVLHCRPAAKALEVERERVNKESHN